jgi:hypothetical protein
VHAIRTLRVTHLQDLRARLRRRRLPQNNGEATPDSAGHVLGRQIAAERPNQKWIA